MRGHQDFFLDYSASIELKFLGYQLLFRPKDLLSKDIHGDFSAKVNLHSDSHIVNACVMYILVQNDLIEKTLQYFAAIKAVDTEISLLDKKEVLTQTIAYLQTCALDTTDEYNDVFPRSSDIYKLLKIVMKKTTLVKIG